MTCCYLCKSSFECSLKQGGIFVPLQLHFEHYCLTDNFVNCRHFIRFASASVLPLSSVLASSMSVPLERERRVSARQKASYPVTLSPYEDERSNGGDCVANALAQTIDLSPGGMRVLATKQVARQGLLFFSFGEGFLAPLLHGLAEVSWQKTYLENDHWEAGLSFTDHFVKAVIAIQMSS